MLAHAAKHGYDRIEVSREEEDAWVQKILTSIPRQGLASCTPGYYNNEGQLNDTEITKHSAPYPGGALAFFKYLQQWRSDGEFSGVNFSSRKVPSLTKSRL